MSGSAESRNHKPRGNTVRRRILIKWIARSPERAQKSRAFPLTLTYIDARDSPRRLLPGVQFGPGLRCLCSLCDTLHPNSKEAKVESIPRSISLFSGFPWWRKPDASPNRRLDRLAFGENPSCSDHDSG